VVRMVVSDKQLHVAKGNVFLEETNGTSAPTVKNQLLRTGLYKGAWAKPIGSWNWSPRTEQGYPKIIGALVCASVSVDCARPIASSAANAIFISLRIVSSIVHCINRYELCVIGARFQVHE
jgi:hypothetical protein